MKTKTAQTGDTITWLVATVVIVVILAISIFAASVFFGKNKSLNSKYFKSADTLASKSFFSYVITEDNNEKIVYEQLKEEENLNDFNGNLASKIFKEFYEKEYNSVWLGIVIDRGVLPYVSNDYFGHRPSVTRGGDVNRRTVLHITENVSLTEKKSLELVLAPKT